MEPVWIKTFQYSKYVPAAWHTSPMNNDVLNVNWLYFILKYWSVWMCVVNATNLSKQAAEVIWLRLTSVASNATICSRQPQSASYNTNDQYLSALPLIS